MWCVCRELLCFIITQLPCPRQVLIITVPATSRFEYFVSLSLSLFIAYTRRVSQRYDSKRALELSASSFVKRLDLTSTTCEWE